MNTLNIFRDKKYNEDYHNLGYVKIGKLDNSAIEELIFLSDTLNIPDYLNCDYNCGMNSDQYLLRKKMQDGIVKIVMPFFKDIFYDFLPYSATFVNKYPNDNCFVHAHQDFTYTNEPEIPSIMCWIPLVDVGIENGAMGFIPESHKFFDHIRAFPFPLAKSAITEHEVELMSYFKIIDMKAGEMVFFMNNTIHGSFGNYSDICRYALAINFYKKGEKIYAYVHNPSTKGKTVFKYEVTENFIVENNNVLIIQQYNEGKINLNVLPVAEMPYLIDEDKSWVNLERKLRSVNAEKDIRYEKIVDEYISFQKKEKMKYGIKKIIYDAYKKIIAR